MNDIRKKPISALGYNFIREEYIPSGKDEYHLRNQRNKGSYRNLSAYEIEVLVRNNNTSDDWGKIQVSDAFNPELVKNCKFYGLVRMGKLEAVSLEYHNVSMPVGLYNSTILSCDFGDNVVINNVNYIAHYIVGSEVMITNVHEIHCTDHAKFGNGIIKEGEQENIRVWVEVCNENAGRKILPFNGMLPGDAHLWSRYRDDQVLMDKFREFTEKKFDKQRGYYGEIGDRCVIKNTSIIKDVKIGSDAYIKGANKLKNLTINSGPGALTQIGEGCELVNGIIDYGCRIFYGVKAVRFVMASHSQLKYGARLINSYLGNNSTISCCEVLNSLIFPGHEQHHNNSFLCAALVKGQSNIAAGATLGSNHNSRAADGEMIAERGFWPGLCVSIKHNSRFASFTLLGKGDYQYELNISLPFSLVSNDEANNRLVVMPGYWFMYNLYALARNAYKYADRDKRKAFVQFIEYDYLAPDSVNEIFRAMEFIRTHVPGGNGRDESFLQNGELKELELKNSTLENNSRPVIICKVKEAYQAYRDQVKYYGMHQLLQFIIKHEIKDVEVLKEMLPADPQRRDWTNVGGQLMPVQTLQDLLEKIRNGSINGWDQVHDYYRKCSGSYAESKLEHAFASLLEIYDTSCEAITSQKFNAWLEEMVRIKEWMVKQITKSRQKDYENPFRTMVYENEKEMEAVIGSLDDNIFITQQEEELQLLKESVTMIRQRFQLQKV